MSLPLAVVSMPTAALTCCHAASALPTSRTASLLSIQSPLQRFQSLLDIATHLMALNNVAQDKLRQPTCGPLTPTVSIAPRHCPSAQLPGKTSSDRATAQSSKPTCGRQIAAAPDGGWGWVVVAASFFIHVLCDGLTYTLGLFLDDFSAEFGVGRKQSAAVPGALTAVTYLVGPLAAVVTNRFGCRLTCVMGSCLTMLGLCLSSIAPNMAFLYLSCSCLAGVGLGLIYLPALVIVGLYFERHRPLAMGLAVCGSGVGTFAFAPLSRLLIDQFTWRGALLLLAALVLHTIVCALVFRPLPTTPRQPSSRLSPDIPPVHYSRDDTKANDERNSIEPNDANESAPVGTQVADELRTLSTSSLPADAANLTSGQAARNSCATESQSEHCLSGSSDQVEPGGGETALGAPSTGLPDDAQAAHACQRLSATVLCSSMPKLQRSHDNIAPQHAPPTPSLSGPRPAPLSIKRSLSYSAATSSTENLTLARAAAFCRSGVLESTKCDIDLPNRTKQLRPTAQANSEFSLLSIEKSSLSTGSSDTASNRRQSFLSKLIDGRLLANRLFLLFLISNFLTNIGYSGPFIFLEDRAKNECLIGPRRAALLVSVIGIGNVIGRVVFGILGNVPLCDRLLAYSTALVGAGLATGLSIFSCSYWSLLVYGIIFGSLIGGYVALTAVVLVDLVGVESLTNSLGATLLAQGAACLGGPVLLGLLVDVSGQYKAAFGVVAAFTLVSGAMLYPLLFSTRYTKRRTFLPNAPSPQPLPRSSAP